MKPKLSIGHYPRAWHSGRIQREVKRLANHCCESCGMEFNEHDNWAKTAKTAKGKRVKSSVHHLDFNKANCDLSNLVFLCADCHLECHRWSWKPGDELPLQWRNKIPRFIIERGIPFTTNQLELWRESHATKPTNT